MRHGSVLRLGRSLGAAVILAAIAGALASAYPHAQGPGRAITPDPLISPQDRAQCLGAAGVTTARQLRTRAIRFVGTEPGNPIPHPRPAGAGASAEDAARSYLTVCGSLFGLTNQAAELTLMRSAAGAGGRSVVRFQQTQAAIPIMAAELIVHLDGAKNIIAVAGEMLPAPAVSALPSVDEATAVQTAIEVTAKTHDLDPSVLIATAPELWVYAPTLIGPFEGAPSLVWRMEVAPSGLHPVRELVLVETARGGVPLHFNQIETARNRETYTANNTTTLPGTLVCNESNPTCAGGDADAIAAHVYAGDTYDFYQANHGRDSLDGAGFLLKSTVHYGATTYRNAFWNGSQMAYGNGFSQADDVVGHELTHGLTNFTSRLYYYYQSGAINESFSDVWGEFIDQVNGRGNDAAGVRWLLGEDIPPGTGAIRNMQNPPALGSPDKMTSTSYYLGADDNGGVHFNSGINNKAAFLMVDGGTFNGQTIAALGIPKVAKIYYEAQTHLLTSGADYADLQTALFQACTNLVGTSGITAGDCQQVWNATLAVEMHLQPAAGFNPDAPVCQAGQTPATVLFDNIESGAANFSFGAISGTSRWGVATFFVHSGVYSLFGYDYPPAVTDAFAALTNGLTIPSNGFLHFAHAYGFEAPSFDGGVLEYSANGGTTWTDAGPLFDANGYNGTISAARGNPLGGRAGFVNASHGYISSRVSLASLAGQTVKFRWRMGLDATVNNLGWMVDDVRIYACGGPQLASVTPNSAPQGRSNLPVAIVGQSTNFVQGQTTVSFGPGVTTSNVTVADATHLTATITLAGDAPTGLRDAIVTTGSEVAAKVGAFTVARAPVIRQISPDRGLRGTFMTVAVQGQFTHFAQGATTASLGPDITVTLVLVTDPTHATVFFSMGNIPVGPRTLTMTTGDEVATLANGFTVTAAQEDAHAFAYVLAKRDSPQQGGTDGTQRVIVIDTTTNSPVTTVPSGQGCRCVGSEGLAILPDWSAVYVANEEENTVSVIRTATNTVISTIPVGIGPIAVAASPSGQRVYVVNDQGPSSVSVIDTTTDTVVATIPIGTIQARGIAITPDGTRVYVTTYGSNNVKVINTATNTVVATIPVGTTPMSIDVSPNGALVYVGNIGSQSVPGGVSVINTATNTVVTTIPVPAVPVSLVNSVRFSPDGARAYLATNSSVSVINTATHAIVGTVPTGGTYAMDFSSDGTRAYVATSALSIVNTATLAVIGSVPLNSATNGQPLSMTVSPPPTRVLSLTGSLNFGEVHVGATKEGTLAIINGGNATMTLNGIVYPAGFAGASGAGMSLLPGGVLFLPVTFAPTVPGPYAGTITVNANHTSGTPTIAVSGVGSVDSTRDGDFDADGKTDLVVYRPSEGRWYILKSVGGFTTSSVVLWGVNTDLPVPGDYDGDGKTDIAVYRPSSGHWFVLKSSTNFTTFMTVPWGLGSDVPVPGDYDGDDKTDIAVYRPSTGVWYVLQSSSNFTTAVSHYWGLPGDQPVPGDYDGDGRIDPAVRRATGHWFALYSSMNYTTYSSHLWGTVGDVVVPGDYDGDRKIDPAVFRPSTGEWFILRSSSNYTTPSVYSWGVTGDAPMVGDYDSDGKADITVFRSSSGHWFVLRSSSGYTTFFTVEWGTSGDIPLPRRP
jgi:bacillolysin